MDINIKSKYNSTALIRACYNEENENKIKTVKLLLDNEIEVPLFAGSHVANNLDTAEMNAVVVVVFRFFESALTNFSHVAVNSF